MNKNILYIGIALIVGLLVGWLVFSGAESGSTTDANKKEMSEEHEHLGDTLSQMWTCSMHPQIMQPEPGDCPICGMDLIPAESGGEGLAMNEIKMSKNAMALANVRTTVVGSEMGTNENRITLSGKIKMKEEENAIQASYFDGRIEQLNVNYVGQEINKGQLLATIYAPKLVAAQQELITAASLKESQPSLYKAVRNKLKLWKLSDKQIDAIEVSGKVKENFPIYATVSGTVSEKLATEGDYVQQGAPIVRVSNLNSVWADFDAYENQLSLFKNGQNIKVVANAHPNLEFDALVSFIDPVLNTQTRTVTVRATLKNKDGLFKPGMFVKGSIQGKSNGALEQLPIPASSVMWTGERSLVYVKKNGDAPVFEMREVTIGDRKGDSFVVVSGLKNGDEIVTNGTFTVDAAAQLQGKKSMMNQVDGEKNAMEVITEMKMTFPEIFQKRFREVLASYLQMKDAYVASDAKQVSTFSKVALNKLQSIEDDELGTMEKAHLSKIIQALKTISENNDLKNQREHFVVLNENMIPIVKNIQNIESQIFIQKCPMANNNMGAIWMSREKEIQNPYYGAAMLTCGSVIEILND